MIGWRSFFKLIFSTILQREYPLVSIPRHPTFNVPYCHAYPEHILLSFSNEKLRYYAVNEDNIDQSMSEILVHEYVHICLWRINRRAGTILNDVNGWNPKYTKLTWKLWRTKEKKDGYVWETVDGEAS